MIHEYLRQLKLLPIGATITHISTDTKLKFAGVQKCSNPNNGNTSNACKKCIGQITYTKNHIQGKVCPTIEYITPTGGIKQRPKFFIPRGLDLLSKDDFEL